ncbi:MAG: hypothetical protein EKK57_10850 [Proteobacteria bacterium]|nr:MAG: hypothetical protein EKK57_10850 [Pseudomonadota bacterium]
MGDNLWITPIFRFVKEPIYLYDNFHCRSISSIYNGITDVQFLDQHIRNFEYDGITHNTIQWLKHLNIEYSNTNIIPFVVITEEEKQWAAQYLSKYPNPIVIINDNSGNNDPQNNRSRYVLPNQNMMQSITDEYSKTNTVLQFGVAPNFYRCGYDGFTPLKNAIHIRGLNIRQLAACYSIIGKYIGGDTGDYHLMLAVGGEATVFIPKESRQMGYIYSNLLYTNSMFGNDKVRVTYYVTQ